MEKQQSISIIVPTLNEAGNIPHLIQRIHDALANSGTCYEVIIIDDHSSDGTVASAQKFAAFYPVRVYLKQGLRGKAYSLLEGFEHAKYDCIGILDADLQYPPEALPGMLDKIAHGADVVVANRVNRDESILRTVISTSFAFVFARLLHGLNCDVQSGMKVFKQSVLKDVDLDPTPWTFDMEFLIEARQHAHTIETVVIPFAERAEGQSKINVLKASYEIGLNALKLKFKRRKPQHTAPTEAGTMIGAGVTHRGKQFITHSTLDHSVSALETFMPWQKNTMLLIAALLVIGLVLAPIGTLTTLVAVLSTIYFFDVIFNFYVVRRSLKTPPEIHYTDEQLQTIDPAMLPLYSILCPLYREAHVLPGFLKAISDIDWPKEKLDVLLLLEQNDPETIAAAEGMDLPSYVRIVVVPHSMPKTKPKACNYGLSLARGEYLVIYDAEDIPDPLQLKKAYLGFQNVGPDVKCLQAKLNYYNPQHNLLTRIFTAEYSMWFDVMLTGLQSLNTYIPLGGTSNHFRTNDLRELQGWDPFNVTEDCDLGIRLFKRGYTTALIDSTTLEEANSHLGNWLRQRSRWIKGYMQTYLVHMRKPAEFTKESGHHSFIFQLIVGGKIAFALINPLLWVMTIVYFTFRPIVGPAIEQLYPPIVFTMAALSLVFGNFMALYYYMIGCAKRGQWQLIKYVYLVPLYWLATSIASYIALYELFMKPHFWQKTRHGITVAGIPIFQRLGANLRSAGVTPVTALRRALAQNTFAQKIKRMIPEQLSQGIGASGGILIMSMLVTNFLNLLFNAYLGRALSFEDLAVVTLVNTLWYIAGVFVNTISGTVTQRVAYLTAQGKTEEGAAITRYIRSRSFKVMLGISAAWLASIPFLTTFFNLSTAQALVIFTPVFSLGVIASANRGYLNGVLRFRAVAASMLIEVLSKFVIATWAVALGFPALAYLAIPLSIVIAAFGTFFFIPKLNTTALETTEQPLRFPHTFYGASLLTSLSTVMFLSLDIILVKHYLTPVQAGQYAFLSLVGKMIYFFGFLPNAFMLPLVRRDEGLGRNSEKTFQRIFLASLTLVAIGIFFLGPLGGAVVPLLLGTKARVIEPLLNGYVAALGFLTLSSIIVSYHLAKKHYSFPILSFLFAIAMAVGIIRWHGSVAQVAEVLFAVCSFQLFTLLTMHIVRSQLLSIRRNVVDFVEAFLPTDPMPYMAPGNKRILIFNWRDTKHVFAGGAEVYIHEIARQWVKQNHHVTVFCSNDGKSLRNEIVDGVTVIRRGGFYFVYLWAALYYVLRFRGRYDLIIDSHNGIPFFTPAFARVPVYCLMHHVHQEVFRRSLPRPLAWFARFLEKDVMPVVYRSTPFITVSESSKQDIQALGLGAAGIDIVHPGVNLRNLAPGEKSLHPTILYLGRLKAYKSVDVLIRAFEKVVAQIPDAELLIAGGGEEESTLKRLASDLKLSDHISFEGKVSDADKVSLMQRAWLFVNPSFMEGWGITTIEANACATPVVASNVPGLRDSVRNPHTGYLVEHGNVDKFAERMLNILSDKGLRQRMSIEALAWAGQFDWEKSGSRFLAIIKEGSERS